MGAPADLQEWAKPLVTMGGASPYGSEGWGFESLRARTKLLVIGSETRADRTLGPLLAIRWQSRRVEHREGSPCVGTCSSVGMTPGG